ncbi:glycosyltransferase [Candidatus Micrarchaeota archaeon]|nr:glycosyltransferase [Candidatus Micrarchaeota archaeon]
MVDVSIVIPTLNEEKNIGRLLKLLRKRAAQLPYDVEIIVCDGNSTDRTREIASRYADKVLIEHVRSAAAERQRGALNASGDIILFIDADSLPGKRWLETMVSAFDDPEVVVVTGLVYPIERSPLEEWICRDLLTPLVKITALLRIPLVYGINMGIRRNVFRQVGGFNLEYVTGEDTDLVRRASKYGRFVFVPRSVVYTSVRRIKKMGRLKFLLFHTINHFRIYLLNKPFDTYEIVR